MGRMQNSHEFRRVKGNFKAVLLGGCLQPCPQTSFPPTQIFREKLEQLRVDEHWINKVQGAGLKEDRFMFSVQVLDPASVQVQPLVYRRLGWGCRPAARTQHAVNMVVSTLSLFHYRLAGMAGELSANATRFVIQCWVYPSLSLSLSIGEVPTCWSVPLFGGIKYRGNWGVFLFLPGRNS